MNKFTFTKTAVFILLLSIFIMLPGCFNTPVDPDFYMNSEHIYGGFPPSTPDDFVFLNRYPRTDYITNIDSESNISVTTDFSYDLEMKWNKVESSTPTNSSPYYIIYVASNHINAKTDDFSYYRKEKTVTDTNYTSCRKTENYIYSYALNYYNGYLHSLSNNYLKITNQ